MQNIINQYGEVVHDEWQLLRVTEDGALPDVDVTQDVIIPLASWFADPDRWALHAGRKAVWLSPADELESLAPVIKLFSFVAIDFPVFTDGRGYSLARLLRERYNYAGELRALGDVWQDQLQALWLVGFDRFEIKQGKPLAHCTAALATFSDHYQSNVRQPAPLFRRSIISG